MNRFRTALTAAVAAVGLGFVGFAPSQNAVADDHGHDKAKVGEKAPNFTLTDLDGNEHTLMDHVEEGKIVVLQWFSPQCPFVVKHYRDTENSTFNAIVDDYADKDVVMLAINSAEPSHPYANKATNRSVFTAWEMNHPILFDADGKIGKMYDAKVTPHMYIIDKDGVLKYAGAIDNDSGVSMNADVNYVRQALDEIIAGETVSTPETRAYGCSVKYVK